MQLTISCASYAYKTWAKKWIKRSSSNVAPACNFMMSFPSHGPAKLMNKLVGNAIPTTPPLYPTGLLAGSTSWHYIVYQGYPNNVRYPARLPVTPE